MANKDDEVVGEMSVYLSKTLEEQLYILQYPTIPASEIPKQNNIQRVRVKPLQRKIEIDYSLDVRSCNYNKTKGEQIASEVDGTNSAEPFFNSSRMDKRTYTSTLAATCNSRYGVAVLKNGAIHITPVNSILQMRPSFEYLDKIDKKDPSKKKKEGESPEDMEVVTVKFSGPSSEKARKAREKSYKYLQEKLENEPWVSAKYYSYHSKDSQIGREKLLCNKMHQNATHKFSTESYLKCLLTDRLHKTKTYPEPEKPQRQNILYDIMMSAKVLQFKQVLKKFPKEQPSNLLKSLQQIGYLIQGCWVIKSVELYKDYNSEFTGTSGDILTSARDFIMWNFTKTRYIKRRDFYPIVKIPIEDLTIMISQVAKKVYNKGWEFKYPFDEDFVNGYPIIIQKQERLWDARRANFVQDLQLGQPVDVPPKKSFPSPPRPKERRQLKYRESVSDDTEESGAESTCSDKMDIDFRKSGKRSISPRKRNLSSPSKNLAKASLSHVPPLTISHNFLLSLPSVEAKAELLNHVRKVLYDKYCVSLPELKESLFDTDLEYITKKEDCSEILEETLFQAGAIKLKNKWPQNTQPVPLYAFTDFKQNYDRYRNALLDLFTNTARSRINFLMKKIEDDHGEIVSEDICKQIFKEYCIYKAGYYYLKGTVTSEQ